MAGNRVENDARRAGPLAAGEARAPGGGGLCDLYAEIAMLRAAIQQVGQRGAGLENLPELLRVLDAVGRASVRLATLLRAQRDLEEERTAEALSRALDEVNRRRGHGHQ